MVFVILGYDALEYELVMKFKNTTLMQQRFGKTNLDGFSEPRTMVIWTSFLAGRNTEKEVLAGELWEFKIKQEDTFFSHFKRHVAIDVPGYTYDEENHALNRKLMKEAMEKTCPIEEYDQQCFDHHKKMKQEFFATLDAACTNKREGKEYPEIIMGYFALPDTVGHMSFGVEPKMRIVYDEMQRITKDVASRPEVDTILIIADHGMYPIGRFGDHSRHGFWSLNKEVDLGTPNPVDFRKVILRMCGKNTILNKQ